MIVGFFLLTIILPPTYCLISTPSYQISLYDQIPKPISRNPIKRKFDKLLHRETTPIATIYTKSVNNCIPKDYNPSAPVSGVIQFATCGLLLENKIVGSIGFTPLPSSSPILTTIVSELFPPTATATATAPNEYENDARITTLKYVTIPDPSNRGKGFGAKLITAMRQIQAQLSSTSTWYNLLTVVADDSPRLVEYWKREGFREVDLDVAVAAVAVDDMTTTMTMTRGEFFGGGIVMICEEERREGFGGGVCREVGVLGASVCA